MWYINYKNLILSKPIKNWHVPNLLKPKLKIRKKYNFIYLFIDSLNDPTAQGQFQGHIIIKIQKYTEIEIN